MFNRKKIDYLFSSFDLILQVNRFIFEQNYFNCLFKIFDLIFKSHTLNFETQHLHFLFRICRLISKLYMFFKVVYIHYGLFVSLTIADFLPALGPFYCSRSCFYCIRWTGFFVCLLFVDVVANSHALRLRFIILTFLNTTFIKNIRTKPILYWLLLCATCAFLLFHSYKYVIKLCCCRKLRDATLFKTPLEHLLIVRSLFTVFLHCYMKLLVLYFSKWLL